MPLFFFHLDEGGDRTPDEAGRSFASIDAARASAVIDARAIMADEIAQGHLRLNSSIDISDRYGRLLDRVRFTDAVRILDGR